MKAITETQKEKIIEMHKTGKYYLKDICEDVGLSSSTVCKVIREYEAERRKKYYGKIGSITINS